MWCVCGAVVVVGNIVGRETLQTQYEDELSTSGKKSSDNSRWSNAQCRTGTSNESMNDTCVVPVLAMKA